jgi:hypothetical protein
MSTTVLLACWAHIIVVVIFAVWPKKKENKYVHHVQAGTIICKDSRKFLFSSFCRVVDET